jgi:hypothetical protein
MNGFFLCFQAKGAKRKKKLILHLVNLTFFSVSTESQSKKFAFFK